MAERILILGASGFIGGYLQTTLSARVGRSVVGTCHSQLASGLVPLDVLDPVSFNRVMVDVRPDLVIFLAGSKNVERCEREPGYAIDINVQAVRNFLTACEHAEVKPATLFFSTDYVFDGLRGHYLTGDTVGPHTVYGLTNLLAERVLLASGLPGVLLRVSAVMGRRGGFFQWLDRSLDGEKPIPLYDNTFFSPTSVGRLCAFVENYANSLPHAPDEHTMKTVHLSDGYRLSRYQFGRLVAQCSGRGLGLLQPSKADLTASTFQADLSLIPDGLVAFHDAESWNELENIF